MKVVIAMDSFKGSLDTLQAGNAVRRGIEKVFNNVNVIVRPLADGGEGTVDVLTEVMNGSREKIDVIGPLKTKITTSYGIIRSTKTAVIEVSNIAGISLVPESKRNPLNTTTYGVGEVIKDAIKKGCRRFIVGLGGSATNDGGIGMLQALGYDCLDIEGKQVSLGAIGLSQLHSIKDTHVISELKECEFHIACDVDNTLYGNKGCSAIYGPQKGATQEMIVEMDSWMKNYEKIALTSCGNQIINVNKEGTGSAGGLGFAFLVFIKATLERGIHIIMKETQLENYIKDADLVITGEGRLDGQTVMGKAPTGVAKLAKQFGIPVIAFSGLVMPNATVCNQHGIDAFFPILRQVCTLEEAMDSFSSMQNLMDTVEQVFRLIRVLKYDIE